MLGSNVGKTCRGGLAVCPFVIDLNLARIQIDMSNAISEVNETSLIFYENGVASSDSNRTSRGLVYTDVYLITFGIDV